MRASIVAFRNRRGTLTTYLQLSLTKEEQKKFGFRYFTIVGGSVPSGLLLKGCDSPCEGSRTVSIPKIDAGYSINYALLRMPPEAVGLNIESEYDSLPALDVNAAIHEGRIIVTFPEEFRRLARKTAA